MQLFYSCNYVLLKCFIKHKYVKVRWKAWLKKIMNLKLDITINVINKSKCSANFSRKSTRKHLYAIINITEVNSVNLII